MEVLARGDGLRIHRKISTSIYRSLPLSLNSQKGLRMKLKVRKTNLLPVISYFDTKTLVVELHLDVFLSPHDNDHNKTL